MSGGHRRWLGLLLAVGLPAAVVPAHAYFGPPEPTVYLAGAAVRDITPAGEVNVGGGGVRAPGSQHIAVRALVVEDEGLPPVVIASIETHGLFAAYKGGAYGLSDMADAAALAEPALRSDHMLLAADHTHAGPDTVGAWGFVPESYMASVKAAAVDAIVSAYRSRVAASMWVGDRVLQARSVANDAPVATLVSFDADATLGGVDGIHGDWPQFLSDALSASGHGVGIAMEGAGAGVQPAGGAGFVGTLLGRVDAALAGRRRVDGAVVARRQFVREPMTNPALTLFTQRSTEGAIVRTPVGSVVIGRVLVSGFPGEASPNMALKVAAAVPRLLEHIPLGLANDYLGPLDHAAFGVSPTVGDHVVCASIDNALAFWGPTEVTPPAQCAAFAATSHSLNADVALSNISVQSSF
jgi:hypothetical protein